MSREAIPSTIGIDIGKNTFHLVGLDQRGAIVLQLKVSRAQLERWLVNISRCLMGGVRFGRGSTFRLRDPLWAQPGAREAA
jgi:hypothetical protein